MATPRLAVAAVIGSLALMGVAPAGIASTASAVPLVGPAITPVLSIRRDPTFVENELSAGRLRSRLAALTGRIGASGTTGCVVVAQGGQDLYSLNPTEELIPASNLKLITASAVLDSLSGDTRLTTQVRSSGGVDDGVLDGDLYLVGGGDPDLMTVAYNSRLYYPDPTFTSLDQLAASVRAAGIKRVDGSVVGDASRYDSLLGVPSWLPEYLAEGDVGPLSALEVDDGAPPAASTTTPTAPPAQPTPSLYAAQTFTELLKAHGVAVTGRAAAGRAPAAARPVTEVRSAPVAAQIEQMLRVSDDTAAELLTKELGYHASGQGTTAAGTAVIRSDVTAAGLPAAQLVALDGSGLDRGDRATCGLLVDVLERSGTAGPIASGLPVAGRSGTLTDRMTSTAAAGRLRAKTGTLTGVSALSGFVAPAGAPTTQLAQTVYFSIIINGMDSGAAALLSDQIATAIAGYPTGVPLRQLEPGG